MKASSISAQLCSAASCAPRYPAKPAFQKLINRNCSDQKGGERTCGREGSTVVSDQQFRWAEAPKRRAWLLLGRRGRAKKKKRGCLGLQLEGCRRWRCGRDGIAYSTRCSVFFVCMYSSLSEQSSRCRFVLCLIDVRLCIVKFGTSRCMWFLSEFFFFFFG